MELKEKLNTIYKNQQKIYDKGVVDGMLIGDGGSIIDESKIIEKTYTDPHQLYVDDVSEIPHIVKVKLTNKNTGEIIPNHEIVVSNQNLIHFNNVRLKEQVSASVGGKIGYIASAKALNIYNIKVLPSTAYNISLDNTVHWLDRICEVDENGIMTVNHSMYTNTDNDYNTYNFITNRLTHAIVIELKDKVHDEISLEDVKNINLQLEYGTAKTDFVERVEKYYTTNDEGEITFKSESPFMLIDANSDDINISLTYNKSWGMDNSERYLWDTIQKNGTRDEYKNYFQSWYDERAFKPRYDLNFGTNSNSAFWGAKLGNVKKALERQGVKFITKDVTNFTYFIREAHISHLPEIDLTSATTLSYFGYSGKTTCIDKLIVNETTPFVSTSFSYWNELTEVRIEGYIGVSISLNSCKYLSKESIKSFIEHLSDNATGTTITFSKTAVNKEFETSSWALNGVDSEEWLALVNTKPNWTISVA